LAHGPAAFSPTASQRLTAQHAVAWLNAEFAFGADMLFQRDNKTLGERDLTQRCAVRLGFHFRRVNAAVSEVFVFSERGK
jgi:hypothetical protein